MYFCHSFNPVSCVVVVEVSSHGGMVCFDKTFEAAEALLHMDSPSSFHGDRNNTGNNSTPPPLALPGARHYKCVAGHDVGLKNMSVKCVNVRSTIKVTIWQSELNLHTALWL